MRDDLIMSSRETALGCVGFASRPSFDTTARRDSRSREERVRASGTSSRRVGQLRTKERMDWREASKQIRSWTVSKFFLPFFACCTEVCQRPKNTPTSFLLNLLPRLR